MDILHLLQVSLFSRFLNNITSLSDIPIFVYIFLTLYMIKKIVPYKITEHFQNKLLDWYYLKDESSIIIPYHNKTYACGLKTLDKILYSERFHAITYYILKNHINEFNSMNETIQSDNNSYYDEGKNDFILVPKNNNRIPICNKLTNYEPIFFEIILESQELHREKDEKGDSDKKTNYSRNTNKKYIYKLSKPGNNSLESINNFLEIILKKYKDDILNKKIQYIFEYSNSIRDEDNDKTVLKFKEAPFLTNKNFQNIFFERKGEFIEFISKFNSLKHNEKKDIEYRESIKTEYKRIGIPYKAVILLYGPPGCGKSSLIKSTAEYTGRNCILVSWTKIKTCSDFISLFRPLKIGNKEYDSRELILVFEDFDANNCNILKTRECLKIDSTKSEPTKTESITTELKNLFKESTDLLKPVNSSDELNLECVLNTLDGIFELYDIIVFFTTNDINSIDPALKRPGRIDFTLNMEKTDYNSICTLLEHRYNCILDNEKREIIKKIPKNKYSYAELLEICSQNKDINNIFETLLEL